MAHIWDDLLTEQDKTVITKAGYDQLGAASWDSRALGQNPLLLVIDMQNHLVGKNVPILEAVEDERTAMGEIAWHAMDIIEPFVTHCREAGIPIIYTRVIPESRQPDEDALQIVDRLKPRKGDIVLDKNYSSAFYGTSLLNHLHRNHSDTVIIVGNSTSGCVRASAVDARQMGFSVLIPQECTFDRIEASHKVSLLDMWMKYANVLPTEEALDYIKGLTGGGK